MRKKQHHGIDLKQNLVLYYVAVAIIVLGYAFLSIGDANSFTSITLGPVVMVIGYLFAVPCALLVGSPGRNKEEDKGKK